MKTTKMMNRVMREARRLEAREARREERLQAISAEAYESDLRIQRGRRFSEYETIEALADGAQTMIDALEYA